MEGFLFAVDPGGERGVAEDHRDGHGQPGDRRQKGHPDAGGKVRHARTRRGVSRYGREAPEGGDHSKDCSQEPEEGSHPRDRSQRPQSFFPAEHFPAQLLFHEGLHGIGLGLPVRDRDLEKPVQGTSASLDESRGGSFVAFVQGFPESGFESHRVGGSPSEKQEALDDDGKAEDGNGGDHHHQGSAQLDDCQVHGPPSLSGRLSSRGVIIDETQAVRATAIAALSKSS